MLVMIVLTCITVVPPPVDVRAIQSSSSAPVEVSWSPPTEENVNITGYRMFYSNGENVSVPVVITSVGLRVDRNYSDEMVFLRSESDRLYSELVNVTVGKLKCFTFIILWSNSVSLLRIICSAVH